MKNIFTLRGFIQLLRDWSCSMDMHEWYYQKHEDNTYGDMETRICENPNCLRQEVWYMYDKEWKDLGVPGKRDPLYINKDAKWGFKVK